MQSNIIIILHVRDSLKAAEFEAWSKKLWRTLTPIIELVDDGMAAVSKSLMLSPGTIPF